MKNPTSDQILESTNQFLDSLGLLEEGDSDQDKLTKLLEVLAKSRNTQSAFYGWEPPHGGGFLRKIKNKIQLVIKNIILNTLEKYVMRQQKYNEVVYQTMMELVEENKRLREAAK